MQPPTRQTHPGYGGAVTFIHHHPPLPNIGDALCTPRCYYQFTSGDRSLAVYGGGAYKQLTVDLASEDSHKYRILWAAGVSHQPGQSTKIDYRKLHQLFAVASTRDPEVAKNGLHLVPCPSVFHPICDLPLGNRIGLFLNASKGATGVNVEALLAAKRKRHAGLVTGTNAMAVRDFMVALKETRTVVTNSYHVAYWSLVSGRSVALAGYSSKFTSLMDLFGQERARVLIYKKGDQETLSNLLDKALERPDQIYIDHPEETKAAFRMANHDFADAVTNTGLVNAIVPISLLL